MNLNFAKIIDEMGDGAAARVANEARAGGEYLFARVLPERNEVTYVAEAATMTVRATMAGMVGMDSPYPPGGNVEGGTFMEQTVKIAQTVPLPEASLRRLHQLWQMYAAAGTPSKANLAGEALNFLNKVVIQPQLDTAEWLRGLALTGGAISWTFNGITLDVDYGIPAANLFAQHTGDDAYGGSTSQFWTDVVNARKLLRYQNVSAIAHPDTIDVIISNSANSLRLLNQTGGVFTIQQYTGTTEMPNTDSRYQLTIYAHDLEGDVLDPADPTAVQHLPFMPAGKLLFTAPDNYDRTYRVGMGSTDDPTWDLALGYTHVAPTVEGDNTPGRWAELDVPQDEPWKLRGRSVSNILPVIEAPHKIVVADTAMP